jgi:4'-phosphopantetheinyl transferase
VVELTESLVGSGSAVLVSWARCAGDVRREAEALLIRAAADALDVRPDRIVVSHDPGGRPCLVGVGSGLHVGVSHCRAGVIAVATSVAGPVGVDIEVVRPMPWQPIARRFMDPGEVDRIHALPVEDHVTAFLRLWTYKEAVGKAYGVGLRGGGLRRTGGDAASDRGWTLRATPADPAMAATVGRPAPDIVLAVACGDATVCGSAAAVAYAGDG